VQSGVFGGTGCVGGGIGVSVLVGIKVAGKNVGISVESGAARLELSTQLWAISNIASIAATTTDFFIDLTPHA